MRQTIDVYLTSMVVLGEALQNAIDAICEREEAGLGKISIDIDFDTDTITVLDNGNGFPKNISLLYLGGTNKSQKSLKGKIGVGIKVSMFSSEYFCIRSRGEFGNWKLELNDACLFEEAVLLSVPNPLPEDNEPLIKHGTQIQYRFPRNDEGKSRLDHFLDEVMDSVSPKDTPGFKKMIIENSENFPSPMCAIIDAFLRRYTYIGDVLAAFDKQHRYPREGIDIDVTLRCKDPAARLGIDLAELFGDQAIQNFPVAPKYLRVEDTLKFIPKGKRAPLVFNERLGPGGSRIDQQSSGFNSLTFNSPEEYEDLLINAKQQPPKDIEIYRRRLFPKINGILLTIGRIPDFERFLPGGSRRIISCNGIVTTHDIDLTRGRNQQYVRCFDLVIDLNADLNYGKTQITNKPLVGLVRDYVNEAYVRVIQNATGKWVGKLPNEEGDEETDVFLGRQELGLTGFSTRKVPRDENDVIGLFFEMMGREKILNYRIFGLSQNDKYDCRAAIQRESDPEDVLEPREDSKLRVVEFKVHASEVIRDFDRLDKEPRDLNLVISWDIGVYQSNKYAIYDIDQANLYKSSPKRTFPYVSKYIYDAKTGYEVQLLVLEDIVHQLQGQ
jgi:hypothetical protein